MADLLLLVPFALAFVAPTFVALGGGHFELVYLSPATNLIPYGFNVVGIAGGMTLAASFFKRWSKISGHAPIGWMIASLGVWMGWLFSFEPTSPGPGIMRYLTTEFVVGSLLLGFLSTLVAIPLQKKM